MHSNRLIFNQKYLKQLITRETAALASSKRKLTIFCFQFYSMLG